MMSEVNQETVCGRKRGRCETQMDERSDQQKKNRSTNFPSDLSIFESLESEEDNVYGIDEERIYNLMRELMEEIGIRGDLPLPPPFQGSSAITYASCDSASSSTNCYSTSKQLNSTGIELGKTLVDRKDWGDYDRAKVNGEYDRIEDFSEVSDNGSFFINDSCICNLNKAFSGDEFLQLDDVVTSDMNFIGSLCETENWVLSASSEPREANSRNESTR
ncbi:hypothetical protein SUGI_1509110 [Cryptomeria japonica]|uniref:Uncharacterized protein n=1 Tax=Cryptomeria japonica TaxID=3369 RepID=A0AAD3NUM8_CRYJA|nr:hypothetical protein SUGI_1508510 [Cryptomeria japonica]GLJ59447.1 hypothetical protein SUGI_1509110 [Cryptomeria japonica]